MTIWQPVLEPPSQGAAPPKYRAIADAIARDLERGDLEPGARLPTHRELAERLGVTVGTVSRAYAEARRRGLVSGQVGRGTFVLGARPEPVPFAVPASATSDVIDLALNLPLPGQRSEGVLAALRGLAEDDPEELLEYQHHAGAPRHREAGARWLRSAGLECGPDDVIVTSGAQHAMLLSLAARTRPGDLVVTEALTYPGLKSLARLLHLRVEGAAIDEEGLRPDAFEAVCRESSPTLLYCTPILQNPTACVMSEARRREIAALASRYDVAIVEDDLYAFLAPEAPPPLASFAPERSFYVASLSKSVAPGLRIGFLRVPSSAREAVEDAILATTWMASPLMAELAVRLLEDGTAEALFAEKRREARARQGLARRMLGGHLLGPSPTGFHLWLPLPEPWRAAEFAAHARRRGVGVSPSDHFAVGRAEAPHAVRVGLGAARDRETLERALGILAELLDAPPVPLTSV